ncbi:hypothetical protein LOS8367_03755 [Limimaricola soesokkakensis]|uniref:Uncharacterized protein n=1 Tax=Limimaricola soesokkakensis TaxID=1343159 RepID=A0A1X7A9Y4_9RHOB|nr:hypothetical protein LOS8367_03755 [Limimaricola soesokkakensis]
MKIAEIFLSPVLVTLKLFRPKFDASMLALPSMMPSLAAPTVPAA